MIVQRHPDRDVARILAEFGFVIVRTTGKHCIARERGGAQVVVPKTPGESFRVYHNIRRDCRRALRQAQARRPQVWVL